MTNQPNSDYDSAWKEAITVYLEPFIEYCFPEVYQDIDWEKGYETLDTELQELIRDAETGRRLADKLLKVTLRNGENALVLIHIEIQGQEQDDFGERMYIFDTPRPKGAGILGSMSPLRLDPLRYLAQRWFSPQALLSPCPEVVVLLQILFARGVWPYARTILCRLVPVNLLPTSR